MTIRPSSLQEELKQTRPFGTVQEEAVVVLLRTAALLKRSIAQQVERHGISVAQYNVLRILRGAGPEGLPTLEIAARMIEHNPGVTRLLDRFEARHLVRRARCPEDRRQVLCHASEAARRLLAGLEGPMADAGRRALAPLDPSRTAELVRLLDAVRASSASPAAPPSNTKKKEQKKRKKETKI